MGRSPCCTKEGLNKGAWTAQENEILRDYIKIHGEGKWSDVPRRAGLKRCGKSCRLRWLNYLRPDIKRGNFSNDEEDLIIRLHKLLGNRWSLIAGRLPGRTDNEIKNYWNTRIGKKAAQVKQSRNQKKSMIKPQPSDHEAPPESGVISVNNALRSTNSLATTAQQDIENLDINTAKLSVGPRMDDNSLDSMIDFKMEEMNFPEMMDFDFTKHNDHFDHISNLGGNVIEGSDGTNSNNSWCKSEGSHIFDRPLEELVDDWSGSDCFQADIASDFRFLTSFLESSEDWLGDA